MHKDMDGLWELQQIDSAIAELDADLQALDDGSQLREQLAEAEAELGRRQGLHSDDAAAQSKLEAELEKAETKRKQIMDKAYGGTISNPKELETLEQEIESLGRTKDRYENQLLELFDKVDREQESVDAQDGVVKGLRARLEETVATHASETERLSDEIARLRAERATAEAAVDASSLAKYERVRERAANMGVAAVEGGMCAGCRVTLPVVQVNALVRSAELQQCESCSRLLWIRIEE
jgi:predicted  nucleic acid-binding Zn-ribbon protein